MNRILLLVALAVSTGCVPAEAIKQARGEVTIARGYIRAGTTGGDPSVVAIGWAELCAWEVQRYALTGERLSEDVAARLKALGRLPEGYEAAK